MGDGTTEDVVCPKEHLYLEPGRGKRYNRISTFFMQTTTTGFALSMVRGTDFTPIDADSQCINLFCDTTNSDFSVADPEAFLDLTPQQLGWTNPRLNRIRNRMSARGIDTTGLTNATPIRDWLTRVGQAFEGANYGPRKNWVAGP